MPCTSRFHGRATLSRGIDGGYPMRLVCCLLGLLLASAALADPKEIARYQRLVERGDVDGVEPLAKLHPEAAAPVLAKALNQRDARMRRAASNALWNLARDEQHADSVRAQTPALETALLDSDPSVAMNTAGTLQALGWRREALVEPRRRVLRAADASSYARFLAARGLIGIDPPADVAPALLAFLFENVRDDNDGRPSTLAGGLNQRVAHQGIAALVEADAAGSIPLLLQAMDSTHPAVPSVMVLTHPARSHVPDWVERLLAQTESPTPGARRRAWALLGELAVPAEARRWVPVAAQRLGGSPEAEDIVSALSAQAGASAAANEALADLAASASASADLRRKALEALEVAAGDTRSRADAAGRSSAQAAGLRAAGSILREPDAEEDLLRGAVFLSRSFASDPAERGRWYADRALQAQGPTRLALLEALQILSWQARDSLDRVRPLLDTDDPALRAEVETTLTAMDPAWQARERRAAVPLATPAPAPTPQAVSPPALQLERDNRPAPPARRGGSFPRFYEAIRQADLRTFTAELDAGLAINEAHQLAPAAQFRITPIQSVVDYCHITELVSTETLVEMARILLQRGADPGLSGSRDRSALEGAIDSHCPESLIDVLQGG
jgi:hypothetical protein